MRKAGGILPWGRVNYTVWSDVFLCPECSSEVVFWDAAVDKEAGEVRDEFACSHCKTRITKQGMSRSFITLYDPTLSQTIKQAKQIRVLINYRSGNSDTRKPLSEFDFARS